MVLYRLLRDLNPDEYCLISQHDYDAEACRNEYSRRLPGRYYQLSPKPRALRSHRSGLIHLTKSLLGHRASLADLTKSLLGGRFSLIYLIKALLSIVSSAGQIASIVRRENCTAVVACTDDLLHLPAGYLASRLTGARFYPYIFDDYFTKWPEPIARFLAQRLEPTLMREAAGIIVPNEFMRDELRQRYGVEATVIHNSCDLSAYEAIPQGARQQNGEIKIVYTGAIYEAHYDAFRNLLAALELLGQPEVKLHIYTSNPLHVLQEKGISGAMVYHEHQSVFEMPRIQREADVLFLPLALNSPYPQLIKTSAPGKTGEYLAASRPVLVHAPPDSFVAWYFRKHECGVVIDEDDPSKLARAIEQLITDEALRQRLSARAWERAEADFSVASAQSRFARLLNLEI